MKNEIKQAYKMMEGCSLCPRNCGVNRLKGEIGFCKAGLKPMFSSAHLHFGEEPPISGKNGSGTIFLTHCSLRCCFCQNHPISQLRQDNVVGIEQCSIPTTKLSDIMLGLEKQGAHNINFVTPTHYMPQVLEAIMIAKDKGLTIPIVYNCGGYESFEALKLLKGVVDIYLPDMKYSDDLVAKKYSSAPDYFEVNKIAIKEMYDQVGMLEVEDGIAKKGLLIRHLVLPGNIQGSEKIFSFIIKELSPDIYVNIMAQYYPCHLAHKFPEINRRITHKEYMDTIRLAKKMGLKGGFRQVLSTINRLKIPEWTDDLKE
ncbi:MAG: radical SAM protein [Candidatus Omnitrophota bacterium]